MEKLIPKVIAWAEERNIICGSSIEKETLKLISISSKITNYINHEDICTKSIGRCIVQMIIICRMKNLNLDDCLNFTKTIKDERVAKPLIASIMVFKTIGELAENVSSRKDIKAQIGYLLIYLTALANSLHLSIEECTVNAFKEIEDYKGIVFNGEFVDETHEKYSTALSIIKSRK